MILNQFRSRKAFERAAKLAADGEIVCGTLVDDRPVYFVMSSDASDAEVRAKAFELRNKRLMNKFEKVFLEIAESTQGSV